MATQKVVHIITIHNNQKKKKKKQAKSPDSLWYIHTSKCNTGKKNE